MQHKEAVHVISSQVAWLFPTTPRLSFLCAPDLLFLFVLCLEEAWALQGKTCSSSRCKGPHNTHAHPKSRQRNQKSHASANDNIRTYFATVMWEHPILWMWRLEISYHHPSTPIPAHSGAGPAALTARRGSRLLGCSRCPAAGSCHRCPQPRAASPQPRGWCPRGRWAAHPCWGSRQLSLHTALPPTAPQLCAPLSISVSVADVNRMCSHVWSLHTGRDSTEGRVWNEHSFFVFYFFLYPFLFSSFAVCNILTALRLKHRGDISQPTLTHAVPDAAGEWHDAVHDGHGAMTALRQGREARTMAPLSAGATRACLL